MNLRTINTPTNIKNSLNRRIPEEVIEERDGGRGTKLKYISGKTVTDMLNSIFGPLNWNFEIDNFFVQNSIPYFDAYAKTKEKVVNPASGKEGLWIEQAPVAWVQGTLTVKLVDDEGKMYEVKKQAFGSKSIIGKQSEQEHIFKSAQTDAMKKAASLLGLGLQIARTEAEEKYYNAINREIIWNEANMGTCKPLMELMEFKAANDISDYDLDCYLADYTDGLFVDICTAEEHVITQLLQALKDMVEGEN